jgi:hypothetical protein
MEDGVGPSAKRDVGFATEAEKGKAILVRLRVGTPRSGQRCLVAGEEEKGSAFHADIYGNITATIRAKTVQNRVKWKRGYPDFSTS